MSSKTHSKFDQICDILVDLGIFTRPEKVVSGIFDLVPKVLIGPEKSRSWIFDLGPQKIASKMTIFRNFEKNVDFLFVVLARLSTIFEKCAKNVEIFEKFT